MSSFLLMIVLTSDTVHHKIIAKSSCFPSKLPVAPPFPWPSRSVARPNAMTLCPWLG